MMRGSGWCVALIGVLVVVVGAMAWKFIVSGSTTPASDGRQAILLSPGERDVVLTEMRRFLESVHGILGGIQQGDMDAVARSAKAVGHAAQRDMPGTLMGKLPLEFKRLGMDTHQRFDQLALDAEQLGDPDQVLESLVELMNNCVACHGAYRLDLEMP